MLGLRPDLVLSVTTYGFDQKNGFATREQLKQVGANSYVSPQGSDDDPAKMTVADSYTLLRDMGEIFNVSSVFGKGIVNDILAKAGGSNAFENASKALFADLSKEKVAATDVDALVVISYNDPNPAACAKKLLKEFPQWSAAKHNEYVVLSDSMYLGPSNDLAVEKIAKMLHPEAF